MNNNTNNNPIRESDKFPRTETVSRTETFSDTETISNTETIYIGKPPEPVSPDINPKNIIINIKGVEKPKLNKDRFDNYDDAWNCFEFECSPIGDQKPDAEMFANWLFQLYIGIPKVLGQGAGS